ncbi:hypothetical protein E2C01_085066 [Portunus trituberculatus]|uniref:Uncharacterized protein n=1 Tax=Portunus trituberculatus TaxID=210409 RepID=A0A5B7J5S9_PORTR|nr:hypothetical protein [Portunus trituberculatus]
MSNKPQRVYEVTNPPLAPALFTDWRLGFATLSWPAIGGIRAALVGRCLLHTLISLGKVKNVARFV